MTMTTELVDLKIDFAFKQIFAREGNETMLTRFLNDILQLPPDEQITWVALQSPELPRISPNHKSAQLDLLVKTEKNVYINVEIQFSTQKEILIRMLWYWAYLFYQQLEKGDPYKSLRKTITIALLNFPLFPDSPDFHTHVWLNSSNERYRRITDLLEMHFLELPKVLELWKTGDISPSTDTQAQWLLLFFAHEYPALYEELEEIFMQHEDLSKLFDQWKDLSRDPKLSVEYGRWLKKLSDEASIREEGLEEGLERGREEGMAIAREEGVAKMRKVAKRLLEAGVDKAFITESTDLSVEELEQLEKELH